MNTAPSLPTAAPVVTYKKVSKVFMGVKATKVLVDGVPTYEIQRLSKYYVGFFAVNIDADGISGDEFVCGGDGVLLREVKETLEGMVLQSYNEALSDPTTDVHREAYNRHHDAMVGLTSRIDDVNRDTIVTSIDGDELPELLKNTFQTIFDAGMNTPLETTSLNELNNVADMVFEAQQMLKEAAEAMQALRARAALLGTNSEA